MVSYEVLNNITTFHKIEVAEFSDFEDLTEKYQAEKECENSPETKHTVELSYQDFIYFASIREFVKITTFVAHDINYQLLEQKIIQPPPEFCLS